MSLGIWQAHIVDDAGNVQNGAAIEVRNENVGGLPLASIYSDRAGATPLANPFTISDVSGYVSFFAKGSAYKITATKGAFTRIWRYVAIGLGGERDIGDYLDAFRARVDRLTLVTGVAKSIVSIPLTPGDYDIEGVANLVQGGSTHVDVLIGGINTVVDARDSSTENIISWGAAGITGGSEPSCRTLNVRRVITVPTTFYVYGFSAFSGGTGCGIWGSIRARKFG